MEYFLAAVTKFLVDQVGFFFLDKFRRDSQLHPPVKDATENDDDAPVTLYSPRSEYLEAMFGDLIEWQKTLQRQGLPKVAIFGLTSLAIGECIFGMLRITLQGLLEEPLHNASEDSTLDDITGQSDDNDDDET